MLAHLERSVGHTTLYTLRFYSNTRSTALLVTGYWYLPPLLGALPLGFNIQISLKVSFKNKMNA